MLDEEYEKKTNDRGMLAIAGVVCFALALLLAAAFLSRQSESATSNSLSGGSRYAASQSGQCGGSCGAKSSQVVKRGCCGGKNKAAQSQAPSEQGGSDVLIKAEKAGLEYYAEKYKDSQVTAKATDFGCHIQVDIYKSGKIVKSLGFDDRTGQVYEIS